MVANKTFVGGRALSLSITAVGNTGAAEAGNEQRKVVPAQLQSGGVPLLLKNPSFHSSLDRQASGDKFIMYDNPAIMPLPRLHGESRFSGMRLHRPYDIMGFKIYGSRSVTSRRYGQGCPQERRRPQGGCDGFKL